MAMIAVYLILSMFNLIGSIWPFDLLCAGAGLGFFTCKGYFDTPLKILMNQRYLDGASHTAHLLSNFSAAGQTMLIYTASSPLWRRGPTTSWPVSS
jgi:ABC-type maltose transport system permease subunit